MKKKRTKTKNIKKSNKSNLPEKIENWTKEDVKQWVINTLKLEEKYGNILLHQEVTGRVLTLSKEEHLVSMGLTHGAAIQIVHEVKQIDNPDEGTSNGSRQGHSTGAFDTKPFTEDKDRGWAERNNEGKSKSANAHEPPEPVPEETVENTSGQENINQLTTNQTCLPYPFDEFHSGHRYIQDYILHIPETGSLNLIDPAHEFKLLTNTENTEKENLKMKFCNEVFRFASACMNSRTNGTIHLGISDNPHGQIVGVKVQNKETYVNYFDEMINKYFEKLTDVAKYCIRTPRFVEVLQQNSTTSETFVIEVDVVPKHSRCQSKFFPSKKYDFNTKTLQPRLFIRKGASSANILNSKDETLFKSTLETLAVSRKEAEEKHREKERGKNEGEGHKLVSLLTGNRGLLDDSHYDWYILVTNKCHPEFTQHMSFLQEINLFAVLEFDPDSASNGVVKAFRENRAANLHFPKQYQEPGKSASDTIKDLKCYQQPSWIFCNGRSDLKVKKDQPLNHALWHQERAAEVRKTIALLSHPDVMQRGKFLVLFLLLSSVESPSDPMIEAFCTFYQELKGLDDMLCICIGTQTYQRWKDLLQARFIAAGKLESRCISNLSLAMVNGTILKLKSKTQTSQRILPSKASSSTILPKKEEDFMTALEILCENQCKSTDIENDKTRFSEFKKNHEEHFYRGGKVSWWNFYFSSENYCSPFIKRDVYEKLEVLIESESQSTESSVKIINLYHYPGCGGTTLAMHILWEWRKKFRCAVLKNKTSDFAEIGTQLTTLITYGTSNQYDCLPVLLLVDDFEEQDKVSLLQECILSAVSEQGIRYKNPLVIILNCMRSQNPSQSCKSNNLSVALKQELTDREQRAFEVKLKEIEDQHEHPEDFYSFMILKKKFDPQYIKNVVKNTLKGLDKTSKQTQLISFLALLNSYVSEFTFSVSQCEDFLEINTTKSPWSNENLEDKMGNCSNIIIQTEMQEYGRYKGVRISHTLIAERCLEEFKESYKLTKSEITLLLLKENLFYDIGIGRDKLRQDVQSMLLSRHRKEHGDDTDTLFSPLIEAIQKEEGNTEVEKVLTAGSLRFNQNVFISQALARHFYIKEKNFDCALEWARKAKAGAPNNSFISDTLGQVYKSEIKQWLEENARKATITIGGLKEMLKLAHCASDAFQKSQRQTENRENETDCFQRMKNNARYEMYNTSGYLGEIETGLYTIQIIQYTPLFNKEDEISRKHMIQFLSGNQNLPKVKSDTESEEYRVTLEEYASYLNNLRANFKKAFDFFDNYFVLLKPRNPAKQTTEFKIQKKVEDFFSKYVEIFSHSDSDWLMNSKLGTFLQVKNYRNDLETSKADTFSGLLRNLSNHQNGRNKIEDIGKMEDIVNTYKALRFQSDTKSQKVELNYILANIILHCLNPNSKMVERFESLQKMLRTIPQQVDRAPRYPEQYFLACLLFWPPNLKQLDDDSRQMEKYITSLKKAFMTRYRQMCRSKQPVALFYLGKGKNLNKFIHKGKIDQSISEKSTMTNSELWQSGKIWKTERAKQVLLRLNGTARNNIVYVDFGNDENMEIPAQPSFLGKLMRGYSTERVSFFLGFSLQGLIAYDIEII
ncbi:sterile alpha motif domain-containing protein 9-like [Tiliqua scincoides]|uniref:sterile alpha motif domain-containing protein 9-like n=1 Tax=Tiliqua scincoides TaxID=71010 RepID=UPI003461CB90